MVYSSSNCTCPCPPVLTRILVPISELPTTVLATGTRTSTSYQDQYQSLSLSPSEKREHTASYCCVLATTIYMHVCTRLYCYWNGSKSKL